MKYYTTQEHFESIYNKIQRSHVFKARSQDEFYSWSQGLREELHKLIGTQQMKRCPANPRVIEEIQCSGYIRKKLLINTEEDIVMPFYMLVPDNLKKGERRTALIACHGHSSNGKEAVAGVRAEKAVSDTINHFNYNYGEVFAQRGYVVFAPDARGFGERRERYDQGKEDEKLLSSSCAYLNVMAISLGQTVMGMWLWDLMRLVDFALTDCDCVNGHVVCAGLSGGGMQSLWLAAMDSRIESCVISGYFYDYLQSLLINYNCLCNYIPNLWKVADMGDIGALICPRMVFIQTGSQDSLNGRDGLRNVLTQVEKVRMALELFGKEKNLFHDIFEGEHKWNGDYVYQWVEAHTPAKWED
ncbi:MAG TPA: hypothetical protein IAC62_05635 [Candidatus Pelethocola excrementipullorum]|nr:hypothetical protein [Candidatus Pelethocola excrementipullorum]